MQHVLWLEVEVEEKEVVKLTNRLRKIFVAVTISKIITLDAVLCVECYFRSHTSPVKLIRRVCNMSIKVSINWNTTFIQLDVII